MQIKRRVFTISLFFVLLIFFTILGVLMPFMTALPLNGNEFDKNSSESDIYKIVDTFYDPDEFYDFRNEAENITSMADFYNNLVDSEDFDIVTSFNQAIEITEFKGDNSFFYNSDEFIDAHKLSNVNIKALQLNRNAYDYYGIEIESGEKFVWDEISYSGNRIPVLLGCDFKKYYHIGDVLRGNYYSKDMEYKVIGFIKEGCTIRYKDMSDLNMDTFMLLPYPSKLWAVRNDFQFESILYFAMINCDVIPTVNGIQVIDDIKKIAAETGFINFQLVGVNYFQLQNLGLFIFVQENKMLFVAGLILIFICSNIATVMLVLSMIKNKHTTLNNEYRSIYVFRWCIIIPYTIAFVLGIFFSLLFLKKIVLISLLMQAICFILTCATAFVFGYSKEE